MGIFKAYDVRGKYPEEISPKLAYDIGRAMVILLKSKNFLVCQDVRNGSKELADEFIRGVTEQGADVTYSGLATTPMFYYFKHVKGFDAGIMITASHLPSGFNGIKAMREGSNFMGYDNGFSEIEELIKSGKLEGIPLAEQKGQMSRAEYDKEYISFLKKSVKGKVTGLKVVIDTSNGMQGPIARRVLDELDIDFIGLNLVYNLENPVHSLNPLEAEARVQLKEAVLQEKAALGVVFDADGDRMFFVDEKGQDVPGDYATALLAKYLAKPGDVIVHDVLCGRAFRQTVEDLGCKRFESRVGHTFIKQAMVKHNARIGGEISSHIFFREMGGGEGLILALLYMMSYINREGKKLSELVQPLRDAWFQSGEVNYKMESNELKNKKIEEVSEAFSDGKQYRLDGVTIEYDDHWLVVRKSNTEPLLRVRVEAKTKEGLKAILEKIESIIKK